VYVSVKVELKVSGTSCDESYIIYRLWADM